MSTFLSRLYPGDTAAGWALGLLVQVAAVVILAALAARLLARRGAAARHGLWVGALACVLASPVVSLLAARAGLVLVAVPLSSPEPAAQAEASGPWVEPDSLPDRRRLRRQPGRAPQQSRQRRPLGPGPRRQPWSPAPQPRPPRRRRKRRQAPPRARPRFPRAPAFAASSRAGCSRCGRPGRSVCCCGCCTAAGC